MNVALLLSTTFSVNGHIFPVVNRAGMTGPARCPSLCAQDQPPEVELLSQGHEVYVSYCCPHCLTVSAQRMSGLPLRCRLAGAEDRAELTFIPA